MLLLNTDSRNGRTWRRFIGHQTVAPSSSVQPLLPLVTLRTRTGGCVAPLQQGRGGGTGVMPPTLRLEADLWGLGPLVRLGLRETGRSYPVATESGMFLTCGTFVCTVPFIGNCCFFPISKAI